MTNKPRKRLLEQLLYQQETLLDKLVQLFFWSLSCLVMVLSWFRRAQKPSDSKLP